MSTKYSLEQIEDIIFQGFDYCVSDDIMEKISNLAMEVGSPDYVKTPIFKKRENPMKVEPEPKDYVRKRRGNKAMEVLNNDDWDAIRTFQPTKIESNTKTPVDTDFDAIRAFINKMTDKNYMDMRAKIIEVIERLNHSEADLSKIGANIFEIASSNRYYSKMYASLYADLSTKFDFIQAQTESHFEQFAGLFQDIEYVDPNENYDRFCEINKVNEMRKSLATFYVNLMNNHIIDPTKIVAITRDLLDKVYHYIQVDNKKNEVEELTETIAILYSKDLYEAHDNYDNIDGQTIGEVIERIANSKVRDYKSLTTKALFKFMDLIEM